MSPAGGVCTAGSSAFTGTGAVVTLGQVTFSPDPGTVGMGTADVQLSLQVPLVQAGSGGGVSNVMFIGMTYEVTGQTVFANNAGGGYTNYIGLGTTTGTINGQYMQDANPATAINNLPAQLTALNCLVDINGAGACGFTFGPTDFTLAVGSETYDFQHTFNVLVPEPATASLLGVGLLASIIAASRRRHSL